MTKIAIVGGGGHARIIAEIISHTEGIELVGCFDDAGIIGSEAWIGGRVLGRVNEIENTTEHIDGFVIGIGNNAIRKEIAEKHPKLNWQTVVHPNAIVSPSAKIGAGSVILAGAVLCSNSTIGNQVIVNANAVVDHDSQIADYTHISIGALIGSNSIVGPLTLIPIGQVIPSFSTIKA